MMMQGMTGKWAALCAAGALLAACSTAREYVKEGAVLRVGVCPDYPPVIFKTNGLMAGIEADLAAMAATHLRTRLEYVELPFDDLIPALKAHKVDVVMSGMPDTDYRRTHVRFTEPYMTIGQMALVRAADYHRFKSGKALYDKQTRAGYIRGTTGELFANKNLAGVCLPFNSADEGLAALTVGSIDVMIDDAPFAMQAAHNNPAFKTLGWLLTDEHLAWALPKDQAYDSLYNELNSFLRQAKQRGDVRRVINRYLDVHISIK